MPHSRKAVRSRRHGTAESRLRIIGGQWRGRKLVFHAAEGLRPTADRVRETLFNWLAPDIHEARCLDLFCGSGALGLEALSRGAAHCDFVDSNSANLRQIEAHLQALGAVGRGRCHPGPAAYFLAEAAQAWDIVFVDPPFNRQLAGPSCELLEDRGLLTPQARVYLEMGLNEPGPDLPTNWRLHRDKRAGGVRYRLFCCSPGAPAAGS